MEKISAEHPKNTVNPGGIVDRVPGDLRARPGNPRTHSDKQLAKLKASMQNFGFTVPVLVDEAGVILAGHARLQAAVELGLLTVPTRVISGLTDAQKPCSYYRVKPCRERPRCA